MTDAAPSPPEPPAPQDRFTPLEARFFDLIPLDYRLTAALVLAISLGGLILITSLTQAPPPVIFDRTAEGATVPVIHNGVWAAFVLSLILTAALGLSEGGRRLWRAEADAVRAALKPPSAVAWPGMEGAPKRWAIGYRLALAGGVIAGLGFNLIFLLGGNGMPLAGYLSSIGLWFILFGPPLYALGIRAGVDLAREGAELNALIRDHVEIDLFHLDRLHVFGRIGLRGAFSWLVMAAIILLFLANPTSGGGDASVGLIMAAVTVSLSALGAVVIFASAVNPVRKRIVDTKSAEIERIHDRIAALRDAALTGDADASAQIGDLVAYEKWVSELPDWPVTAPVTRRFALYILIPALAWSGSALVERLVGG